ncbi:hypothetical protein N7444_013733 [Penicillium canescens]|nr:hypothetical protein N7444_013733 [Penicillium canescens]
MLLGICSPWSLFLKRYLLTLCLVFGRSIDVLGIIIYGTELVLWIGIFICGGIFNLFPWIKKRSSKRALDQEPVLLHPMPSSTSVFRTASGSQVVERRAWQNSS